MKSNISKRLSKVELKQEELQENVNLQLYRVASLNQSKHVSAYYYFFVPFGVKDGARFGAQIGHERARHEPPQAHIKTGRSHALQKLCGSPVGPG